MLSARGINKDLNAALQRGSKCASLLNPLSLHQGDWLVSRKPHLHQDSCKDKVKLRAAYFLGCSNSFAAHLFHSPGEPGYRQHATLVTSQQAQGRPSDTESSSKSPRKLWPRGRKVSNLQRTGTPSSFLFCPLLSITQSGENRIGVRVRLAPFGLPAIQRGFHFLSVWACSRLGCCTS